MLTGPLLARTLASASGGCPGASSSSDMREAEITTTTPYNNPDRIVEGAGVVGYYPKVTEKGWILDLESDPNTQMVDDW